MLVVRGLGHSGIRSAQQPEEARLLLLAALVPAACAVGTSLIMALSGASHDLVPSVGTPYRNTMVTWTMLALTAGLVLAAMSLRRAGSLLPLVVAGLAVFVLSSTTVAANYPLLRASRVDESHIAVAAVHREIVMGDPSSRGDERRCATLDEVGSTISSVFVRERLTAGAKASYQHYHGGPYCTDRPPSQR